MGPVQLGAARKKSNRGRKSMQSMVLTSPEVKAKLQEKADLKAAKADKAAATAAKKADKKATKEATKAATPKTPGKRLKTDKKSSQKRKKQSSTSSEDVDFCMAKGCGQLLDMPMTKNNTIECNKCGRSYHLRCVTVRSYFTYENCDSDLDVSDE